MQRKTLVTGFVTMILISVIVTACGNNGPNPLPVSSTTSQNPTESVLPSSPSPSVTTSSSPTTEYSTAAPSAPITTNTITTAQAVPFQYLSLYNQLQGYVAGEDHKISAKWDGSTYPVSYAAELLTADTNAGPGILQNSEKQVMLDELDGELSMGVTAVTVEIGFPVFDPDFYIFTGQSASQAQQTVQNWLDYYQSLAQAIHSRGLKMIVEANPLLTYYISSDSSFNPGSYYRSLDFPTYQRLRSQHNIILAQQIKPDYLLLQTEPQTDAVNDFRPELNNAAKDTAMVGRFVTDLENTGIPGLHKSLELGSGAGTWQPDWETYFSGLTAIRGLDKIDTHIYNLQPNVNQLGEVTIAIQIADMAHAAGKGVTMSEFWLHKSVTLVGLTESGDTLADIRARDMFDFWAPLDELAFQMLSKLVNYKHFDYVSAFGHYHWFSLVDYDSLPAKPVYPASSSTQNDTVDNQITTLQNQSARQAMKGNVLSPAGKAYKTIIAGRPLS